MTIFALKSKDEKACINNIILHFSCLYRHTKYCGNGIWYETGDQYIRIAIGRLESTLNAF
jgi:hypothetical protein